MNTPDYIKGEMFQLPLPPLLTRDEFVAKYMPQYVEDYKPDYRIRTYVDKNHRIRVPHTTPGSIKSQVTKRNNRIDAEYEGYKKLWESEKERMKSYEELDLKTTS